MNDFTYLDIDGWKRKEHYQYFKAFDEPFFGLTVNINCNESYELCKDKNWSFFLYYLHSSLVVANQIPNFKYRIEGEQVKVYQTIHASATVNREDGTFGFSFMPFQEDFEKFVKTAQDEIRRIKNGSGILPKVNAENVIHFSSLPWIKFTGLSHARKFSREDSCPKISFGKMIVENTKRVLPLSIHVHHALIDGLHVARYLESFQEIMGSS